MAEASKTITETDQATTCIISVSALQRRLREIFQQNDPQRALSLSLEVIGGYFDGVYMVMHASLGPRLLSEEWYWDEFEPADALRESVNDALTNVMSIEAARCVRMGPVKDEAPAVMSVPIFDGSLELSGGAALVVGPCSRNDAFKILSQFEGIVGFLSLLASERHTTITEKQAADGIVIPKEAQKAAGSPLYLAYSMAAHLKNRHALDQVCIGFVERRSVRVVAICGVDEIRASNPGIKLVRAAMEECLDRQETLLCAGFLTADASTDLHDDCRIHAQWSQAVGGDAVASLPIESGDRVVAIVSVRADQSIGLHEGQLEQFSREMAGYSTFVPISNLASRSLLRHSQDAVVGGLKRIFKRNWQRNTWLSVLGMALAWFLFGSMSYSFTVPCEVKLADPSTIAAPREGILATLHVRPGDRVKRGELLASFASEEVLLNQAQSQAELLRIEAMLDRAVGEGKPGEARVLTAQREETLAQLAIIQLRLQRSEIRAPRQGIIMSGDLRQRIGGQFALGEPLFVLAPDGRVRVHLLIPEDKIWDGREALSATFSPGARPAERIELEGLEIRPDSITREGKNVFIAESEVLIAPDYLSPGMEGVVHLEVGDRPVYWIFTHRIIDWLRLRFWL